MCLLTGSIGFTDDGLFVAWGNDAGLFFWDMKTWEFIEKMEGDFVAGDSQGSRGISINQGKNWFYLSRSSVLELFTGNVVKEFSNADFSSFYGVTYSPDGKYLVLGGFREITVIDLRSYEVVSYNGLQDERFFFDLIVLDDNETLITASDNLLVWRDFLSGEIIYVFDTGEDISTIAISNDGKIAAVVGKSVVILDSVTRKVQTSLYNNDLINCITFSQNSELLIAGTSFGNDPSNWGGYWVTWDLNHEYRRIQSDNYGSLVYSIDISSDNDTIFTGGIDTLISSWDVKTGKINYSFGIDYSVFGVKYLSDSIVVGYGSGLYTGKLIVWDAENEKLLNSFDLPFDPTGLAIDKKSGEIAVSFDRGIVGFWKVNEQ